MLARPGLVLAALLTLPGPVLADEAVRRDGTRVTGTLSLAPSGRFTFRSDGRDEPIAGLELVRFKPTPPAAPPVPLWHQVRLGHGEVLFAEVLRLDATHLHVRTAGADRLAVPRPAVERVTNVPGTRPVLFDLFANGLGSWTTAGGPRTTDGRLVLDRAGQWAEAGFKVPLPVGKVAVGFRATRTTGRRAWLDLAFVRDGKPASVRVELVGPGERYAIESAAKPRLDGRLKRETGPRRLSVEFDADRLHVFLDDLVMWTQAEGPGALRTVKLVADGAGTEAAEVDDVLVTRPESKEPSRPWADLTADAVRSPDADETFGNLVAAGPTGVTLEVKGQKRTIGWPDVSAFAFRRAAVTERATTGEHVQVRVHTADGARDVLEGAVKSLDAKSLVLAHAILGDLTVPRDRLEEIRLRFNGRRIPVDATPRHLGARPAFGFAVPKPEGLAFARTVTVAAAASGFVGVDAAQVGGKGTPIEVHVNGEVTGELNKQVDRAEAIVRTYRLPLPAIRAGDVALEIRLRSPKDGSRVTGVDLRGVWLECHDP